MTDRRIELAAYLDALRVGDKVLLVRVAARGGHRSESVGTVTAVGEHHITVGRKEFSREDGTRTGTVSDDTVIEEASPAYIEEVEQQVRRSALLQDLDAVDMASLPTWAIEHVHGIVMAAIGKKTPRK